MSEQPTIYLTNAASRKPPHRGPGRVWTIMAAPRARFGEAGEGVVEVLVPALDDLRNLKSGAVHLHEYRARYNEHVTRALDAGWLAPGDLYAIEPGSVRGGVVLDPPLIADGDTLLCCCSRTEAAADWCHRAWAGRALLMAGWQVVLDGNRLGAL